MALPTPLTHPDLYLSLIGGLRSIIDPKNIWSLDPPSELWANTHRFGLKIARLHCFACLTSQTIPMTPLSHLRCFSAYLGVDNHFDLKHARSWAHPENHGLILTNLAQNGPFTSFSLFGHPNIPADPIDLPSPTPQPR